MILTDCVTCMTETYTFTFQMSIQAEVILKGTLKEEKVNAQTCSSRRLMVFLRVEAILKPTIRQLALIYVSLYFSGEHSSKTNPPKKRPKMEKGE